MFVKVSTENRISVLTICRPSALNALNAEVIEELRSTLSNLQNTSVAILTGEGKSFVAGADIAAMKDMTPAEAMRFSEMGQSLMASISDAPFVTLAAVNGFALGGGLELALACDLIYASDKAKLGLPETNLGLIPGFGGTSNLAHRIGFQKTLEMILRGHMISAVEAKSIGLVVDVFSETDFMIRVRELAMMMAKKGSRSLLAARRLLRQHLMSARDKEFERERQVFGDLFSSPEPKEGLTAFLEKREARFHG